MSEEKRKALCEAIGFPFSTEITPDTLAEYAICELQARRLYSKWLEDMVMKVAGPESS